MLRTTADLHGTTVEVTDFVTPAEPVLVRGIRSSSAERVVVHIAPSLDGDERSGAGYVDPGSGALVFYLRDVALAVALVASDTTSTLRESNGREPSHDVVVYRAPVDGLVAGGLVEEARVLVAFGATPDEAIARLRRPATVGSTSSSPSASRTIARRSRWRSQPSGDGAVRDLYARSLLVLEQLTDRKTGATIAAPEFDPSFEQSGGYGFVWPRDLGYVVLSFLAAGRGDLAVPALRWLAREQAPEGLWLQRYWTDGSLAPSWGLHQLDETGMAVFAYEAAWRELGDAALDRELWPSARAAADFLCTFVDEETGLPLPSVDLWEQTDGQHSYSAAATYGGLVAAAAMATRHEPALAERYRAAAERVRAAIDEHLWSDEHGRYLRSRWVGRSDELGEEPPAAFDRPLRYPTKAVRSVDREDARVDSSLLGLAWPFRAVDPASPRMRATLEAVERELRLDDGGVLRHQDDDYAGGNPWLISTLWLGLAERQAGDDAGHRASLEYALARQTPLGLLPEQVTRDGEPAWAVPLGWSHAMLILAARPELALVRDGA